MKTLILLLAVAGGLFADVVQLLPSNEKVTFTGLGGGKVRIDWGNCVYDGKVSTCTVSGNYTGLGGGAYRYVLMFAGNGASPLEGTAQTPGSDLVTYSLTSGSFQEMLTPAAGGGPYTFYSVNFNVFFDPTAETCTGVAQCGVGQVGLTAGATITGSVSGRADPSPVIRSDGGAVTVTGYGGSRAIAPGTWMEIYGTNLSTTLQQAWAGGDFKGSQAPVALGGTTVTVGGKAAFVQFVSPGQVNVQVPSSVPLGQQTVVVTTAGGQSVGYPITVNAVQPGILSPAAFSQYAVAQFADGVTYVLPPGTFSGIASRRAKPGETVVMYGVGFGPVNPNIDAGVIVGQSNRLDGVQVSIGGQAAVVQYAGLVSQFLGLYQFNVVIPQIAANDKAALTFSINGTAATQTLYLPIGN